MQERQVNNTDHNKNCYVCESEFVEPDPTFSHLSFKEIYFYSTHHEMLMPNKEDNSLFEESLNSNEYEGEEVDHSLSIQKNLNTNEYEVIKKYNRILPEIDLKKLNEELTHHKYIDNQYNLFKAVLDTDEVKKPMLDCLNVVYKSKDLWDAVKRAEEISKSYVGSTVKYRPCRHKEPELAPLCTVKERTNLEYLQIIDGKIEIDSNFGKEIGFTSDRFEKSSSLFKKDNDIILSCLTEKLREDEKRKLILQFFKKNINLILPVGNIEVLVKRILKKGYGCIVPDFLNYRKIAKKMGFELRGAYSKPHKGVIPLWVKGSSDNYKKYKGLLDKDRTIRADDQMQRLFFLAQEVLNLNRILEIDSIIGLNIANTIDDIANLLKLPISYVELRLNYVNKKGLIIQSGQSRFFINEKTKKGKKLMECIYKVMEIQKRYGKVVLVEILGTMRNNLKMKYVQERIDSNSVKLQSNRGGLDHWLPKIKKITKILLKKINFEELLKIYFQKKNKDNDLKRVLNILKQSNPTVFDLYSYILKWFITKGSSSPLKIKIIFYVLIFGYSDKIYKGFMRVSNSNEKDIKNIVNECVKKRLFQMNTIRN